MAGTPGSVQLQTGPLDGWCDLVRDLAVWEFRSLGVWGSDEFWSLGLGGELFDLDQRSFWAPSLAPHFSLPSEKHGGSLTLSSGQVFFRLGDVFLCREEHVGLLRAAHVREVLGVPGGHAGERPAGFPAAGPGCYPKRRWVFYFWVVRGPSPKTVASISPEDPARCIAESSDVRINSILE